MARLWTEQVLRGHTWGSREEVQEGPELLLSMGGERGCWGGRSSGVCLAPPAGPRLMVCESPPPPGAGADLRAGSLYSQQSCPASLSHRNPLRLPSPLLQPSRLAVFPPGPPRWPLLKVWLLRQGGRP